MAHQHVLKGARGSVNLDGIELTEKERLQEQIAAADMVIALGLPTVAGVAAHRKAIAVARVQEIVQDEIAALNGVTK